MQQRSRGDILQWQTVADITSTASKGGKRETGCGAKPFALEIARGRAAFRGCRAAVALGNQLPHVLRHKAVLSDVHVRGVA